MLTAPSIAVPKRSEAEVDAYLKLHQDILDTLRESFRQPHPYVDATRLRERDAAFTWPQSIKDHEKLTLATSQYDCQQVKKYLIILDINSAALPKDRGDSETMAATTILTHYLGPVEKLGFRSEGSSLAAISAVQYSANRWVPSERLATPQTTDSPAWIDGEVFYAPREAQVVIRVTVGGRFVPQGAK